MSTTTGHSSQAGLASFITAPRTHLPTRAEILAESREMRAAEIAQSAPLPATWRAGVDMTDTLQAEITAYGAACALQALTESEAR